MRERALEQRERERIGRERNREQERHSLLGLFQTNIGQSFYPPGKAKCYTHQPLTGIVIHLH